MTKIMTANLSVPAYLAKLNNFNVDALKSDLKKGVLYGWGVTPTGNPGYSKSY
jgi:hypothetical protein